MSDVDRQLALLRAATEDVAASASLKQSMMRTASSGGVAAAGIGGIAKILMLVGLVVAVGVTLKVAGAGIDAGPATPLTKGASVMRPLDGGERALEIVASVPGQAQPIAPVGSLAVPGSQGALPPLPCQVQPSAFLDGLSAVPADSPMLVPREMVEVARGRPGRAPTPGLPLLVRPAVPNAPVGEPVYVPTEAMPVSVPRRAQPPAPSTPVHLGSPSSVPVNKAALLPFLVQAVPPAPLAALPDGGVSSIAIGLGPAMPKELMAYDPRCSTSPASTLLLPPVPLGPVLGNGDDALGLKHLVDRQHRYLASTRTGRTTLVALKLRLPEGVSGEDVVAPDAVDKDGWFATSVRSPLLPLWFVLPGYEPLSVRMNAPSFGEWYLGEVAFRRPDAAHTATLVVHTTSPGRSAEVWLHPHPCPGIVFYSDRPVFLKKNGPKAVFEGLTTSPWRIVVREPRAATVERMVWGLSPGITRVDVRLEVAKTVRVEAREARLGELCSSLVLSTTQDVRVGEDFDIGSSGILRIRQVDGGVSFDKGWRAGFVGNGTFAQFCEAKGSVLTRFDAQTIQTGDVFRIDRTENDTTMLIRVEMR